jgi:hypothetical protein
MRGITFLPYTTGLRFADNLDAAVIDYDDVCVIIAQAGQKARKPPADRETITPAAPEA